MPPTSPEGREAGIFKLMKIRYFWIFIAYPCFLGCGKLFFIFFPGYIQWHFVISFYFTGEEQHYLWKGEFTVIALLYQCSSCCVSICNGVIWASFYFAPFRCSQIDNSVERTCLSSNGIESKELHRKRKHIDGEDQSSYVKPDAKILRSSKPIAREVLPRRSTRLISKVFFTLLLLTSVWYCFQY